MLVLPNPQLAVQTALQSFPEQSVVHLNWLKNPQIMVLRKQKCFIKAFPSINVPYHLSSGAMAILSSSEAMSTSCVADTAARTRERTQRTCMARRLQ